MAEGLFLGAVGNALGTLMVDAMVKPIFRRMKHYMEDRTRADLELMPSKDVVASKSSTVALNTILDSLKDEKVKMIGVYGMGGVGKTTLVTQVGYMVKELGRFKVKIVVVTQTPSIENIQYKIADSLGLKFEKTTLEEKANELWKKLEKEEKVLIILDDMWKKLNLKDIGIPLAEKGKGCKIILTTRKRRVCEDMQCQVTVPVDVFGREEAWNLFKMKANLDETRVSEDIIKEAKKVAEECKGLPVAIVTLASSLKGTETREGWESAREYLEQSRLLEIGDIGEEEKNAYLCIKMSYDYLKREETKRCFLLCALYPEDHLIDIEDLVRYAWGLQLYGEADSVKKCRNQVLTAIKHLKDSCLLLEDTHEDEDEDEDEDEHRDVGRYIKLHDVVRDVALWIASKKESGFLIKSRLELLNVSSESCNAISLLNSKEKKFPEKLSHSKLEIMLLNNCDVQGTCFQGMGELKVLSLSVVDDRSVISLYALTPLQKLRTLILENFEDISFLEKLKTLKILSLRHSNIMNEDLANLLGGSEGLEVLDLSRCEFHSPFPRNIIRRMSKLEEVYLKDSILGEKINYILAEVYSLSRLTALSFTIPYEAFRDDEFKFLAYERYDVSITGESGPYCADFTEKIWKIKGTIPLIVFSKFPENLVSFKVSNHLKMSCICEIRTQHARLRGLVDLKIDNCPSLKSLFPLSLAQSLVLLEKLVIIDCHGLTQIVTEEISSTTNSHNSLCFPKLKMLSVENCEGLEYIFPTLMAPQGLQGLIFIIENCDQLKQVIKIPEHNRVGNNSLFKQQLESLRSLHYISISGCPQLTDSVVHLEAQEARLEVVRLSAFKESLSTSKHLRLIGVIEDHNLVPDVKEDGLIGLNSLYLWKCNDFECLVDTTTKNGPTSAAFTHLERLIMRYMDGLVSLCKGQPPHGFLKDLKELEVIDCKKLQVLFHRDEDRDEKQDHPLSNLQSLKLETLPELRWILKGSAHSLSLQSLKVARIHGCGKLESLFSPSLIQSLELLEELKIESCPELKTLFEESESSSSRPLCLPKLKTIEIYSCSKLEYVVPVTLAQGLHALKSVSIYKCGELKQVLGMAKEEDGVEQDLHLPSLQKVYLKYLESLTSFVPDKYSVKAPALKTFKILGCPKMMKVSIQQEVNKQLELELEPWECIFEALLRGPSIPPKQDGATITQIPFTTSIPKNFGYVFLLVQFRDRTPNR